MMNTDVAVHVGSGVVLVPVVHRTGLTNLSLRQDEPRFVELLTRVLMLRDGAIVDVGASIGRFLLMVLAADRSHPYLAFEPSVSGCAYIQRLIQVNRLQNHSVIPVALGTHIGVAHLSFNSATDAFATTTEGFYGPAFFSERAPVPCFDGDTLVAALTTRPVALIKIDVEGGELEVLMGLAKTIERSRPALIVEIIPPYANDASEHTAVMRRSRIARLDELLREWGYQPYKIARGDRLLPRTGRLDPGRSTDTREMDYLCVTSEVAHGLKDLIEAEAVAHNETGEPLLQTDSCRDA